jgi:hypothetical protein
MQKLRTPESSRSGILGPWNQWTPGIRIKFLSLPRFWVGVDAYSELRLEMLILPPCESSCETICMRSDLLIHYDAPHG